MMSASSPPSVLHSPLSALCSPPWSCLCRYFDGDKREKKGSIRIDAVQEVLLKNQQKDFHVQVAGRAYKFSPTHPVSGDHATNPIESPSAARWVCAIECMRLSQHPAAKRSLQEAFLE